MTKRLHPALIFGMLSVGLMSQRSRFVVACAMFVAHDPHAPDLLQEHAVNSGIVFG